MPFSPKAPTVLRVLCAFVVKPLSVAVFSFLLFDAMSANVGLFYGQAPLSSGSHTKMLQMWRNVEEFTPLRPRVFA